MLGRVKHEGVHMQAGWAVVGEVCCTDRARLMASMDDRSERLLLHEKLIPHLSNQTVTSLGESHNRWCGATTLCVGDDCGLATLHSCNC